MSDEDHHLSPLDLNALAAGDAAAFCSTSLEVGDCQVERCAKDEQIELKTFHVD